MLEKLQAIENRYEQLTQLLSDPEVISDINKYKEYAKEHSQLEDVVQLYRKLQSIEQEAIEAKEMLADSLDQDTRDWVEDEFQRLQLAKREFEQKLHIALLPKDPRDEKNVLLEIRAGAGGGEAALFAATLHRMYSYYAERQNWSTEVISASYTDIGGFKEVIIGIKGKGAFSRLKYESGVHRVQRIPSTESGGRIHTSTATVAVLPEAEDVDVEINPDDLDIDTYSASGPGGQHVNKTQSAIRITHRPSGIVVTCQDEKSQHKNKAKALKVLRTRLFDIKQAELHEEEAEARRSQVGTGDRSERIRTYNFPQGRVTDHRIGLTLHKLDLILEGDLDDIINALALEEEKQKLSVQEG